MGEPDGLSWTKLGFFFASNAFLLILVKNYSQYFI